MKITTYLKITSSLVAIAAASTAPVLAQSVNGWTGGSSYHDTCDDDGDPIPCNKVGTADWNNSLNWSNGVPTSAQDVNIGLSTYESGTSERPAQQDSVVINAGYEASAGSVTIGFAGSRTDVGSAGAGNLTNFGSLTVVNGVVVGSTGNGTFNNNGALDITEGSLVIGQDGMGDFVNGAGSSLSVSDDLVVGEDADGSFSSVTDVDVGGNTVIGQHASAEGQLSLSGGADLTTGGSLTVGESGAGYLSIGIGSAVTTDGAVVVGQNSSSQGNRIDVAGSMENNRTFTIGQYGEGAVYVEEGGSIDTQGRVTLGSGQSGEGFLGNSGTVNNHDRLIVGEDGFGVVYTLGADAVTNTSGNVTLGDDDNGLGLVIVDQGEMNNSGRLDVGSEGEGYLLVRDGGEINNSIGVMAKEEGSRGFGVVTGEGSLWDNRTSLTIAEEEDTGAVLVINEGGTVRIADGEGTLLIAAEVGSTGILNIGAYSPTGGDYGLDGRITDLLDGEDTDSTPRGAGTLDAAYVEFGDGTGIVNFSHTETEADDYRFGAGFVGEGTVNHYAGFTVLDGDSSEFTGDVNVVGGTLVANNTLAGDVTVGTDGILRIGHLDGTTGDVVNDITNNGLVEFNRSDVYVFDSVISGVGDVSQIGSGTTVLTAQNSYTGETSITDGTLQLGNGGTTGSINATSGVTIGTEGTLAFNRSDNVIFDRYLSGRGQIAQIGSGMTRLTEDNSAFDGLTRVEAGILSVNGVLGGTVEVNGGTLEGLGAVGSTNVHDGGTIAPGNGSIGTLTIGVTMPTYRAPPTGNLVQDAGSTYQAEVLSTGESDLILVDDEASIESGAVLNVSKLDNARYDLERRYTVLTANGGVSGDYTLTGDTIVSTFYQVEDRYDPNNVYLKVNQHRLFQEAGVTPNQIAAATAAQELKGQVENVPGYETTGRPTNALFRAIAYLPTDELAQQAFDQISGEIYASTKVGLIEQSRYVRDATGQRIRDAFGGVGAKGEADDSNGLAVWGHGFGSWSEIDGDGNAGSFTNNTGGFFLGADVPIGETFRVGVVGGYSHSSFSSEGRGSSASSDNFDLGLYGGGQVDNFGFRLGGNYTWHNVSTDRDVNIPGFADSLSSDYSARTAQVYGDIGYTVDFGGASFEPFVGLAYVNVDSDDYRESGGAAALSGSGDNLDATFTTLGLRAATTFKAGDTLVKATGMLGWRHAFDDVNPTATHSFAGGSPFTVSGVPLAQDVAVVEAGIETALSDSMSVGVSYTGQFGSGVSDHGVRANLNWKY